MIAGTIGSLKALRVRGTRPHAEDNFRFAKMSAGPAAWMRDSASMSKPKAASTSEHESSAVSQHEENRAPAQAAIKAFTAAAARTEELPRPLPWKPQGRSCDEAAKPAPLSLKHKPPLQVSQLRRSHALAPVVMNSRLRAAGHLNTEKWFNEANISKRQRCPSLFSASIGSGQGACLPLSPLLSDTLTAPAHRRMWMQDLAGLSKTSMFLCAGITSVVNWGTSCTYEF